jgi:hypothetical protein
MAAALASEQDRSVARLDRESRKGRAPGAPGRPALTPAPSGRSRRRHGIDPRSRTSSVSSVSRALPATPACARSRAAIAKRAAGAKDELETSAEPASDAHRPGMAVVGAPPVARSEIVPGGRLVHRRGDARSSHESGQAANARYRIVRQALARVTGAGFLSSTTVALRRTAGTALLVPGVCVS